MASEGITLVDFFRDFNLLNLKRAALLHANTVRAIVLFILFRQLFNTLTSLRNSDMPRAASLPNDNASGIEQLSGQTKPLFRCKPEERNSRRMTGITFGILIFIVLGFLTTANIIGLTLNGFDMCPTTM